ncbi:MAG: SPFH domain-containing protein [Ruminococcaceae bacterium]|nr:SPFH domain-containing protein [Oscillospiraceae bacterium]
MGLIRAALGSVTGVISEQWKDFFKCEGLSADVLAVRGRKVGHRAGDDVITDGSVIVVADGQCMIIVDQGKIAEVCAEPGEYTYDSSTEPSVFCGDLGEGVRMVFENIGKRFTFGGVTPKDQRVYYLNTKEIIGNKYGTPSPVPFRVVDQRAGIDVDISVRCFGEYSYKITNPLLFYTNVCGNISGSFTREQLDSQLKSELLTALQPAFARISALGIRYSALPGHTQELSDALATELSERWRDFRGIEIQRVAMASVKASEEDERLIKHLQALGDPRAAAAYLAGSQGASMQDAAKNSAGAAVGFMGLNMAQNQGGLNASELYQMAAQQPAPTPAPAAGWKCSCGAVNTGKFCAECGAPKPAAEGWQCSCGSVNKGKFCPECGAKKPTGVPQYKCDKCGWEPEKGSKAPKFCPECGDPFDDGDMV